MKEYKETRHSLLYKHTSDLSFYAAGIEACSSGYSYGPRTRPYHLIHFVLEGKGYLEIDNKKYELKSGDIFIIPADHASLYKADEKKPWKYAWVSFLGLYSEMYIRQIQKSISEEFVIRNRKLENYHKLIKELIDIKENSTSAYFYSNSILLKIISYLFNDIKFDENEWGETYLADDIKFYLEMNYSESLKLYEVAEEFNIHPNYMTRIFKERFNITPKAFVNHLKFQKAKGLLETTDLPIALIAHSVGIDDPFAFSKSFKALYGISPTKYRKEGHNKREKI